MNDYIATAGILLIAFFGFLANGQLKKIADRRTISLSEEDRALLSTPRRRKTKKEAV